MEENLQLKLVEKYPKILRDFRGDPMETCMAWGIETDGNGWYDLLDKCMEKLQYFCDLCSKDGKVVEVVANQVKSKYGTLRFYYTTEGANDIERSIIGNIVSNSENRSAYICEVTGKDGESCVKWGWYKTLCYEEARKQGYKACNEDTEEYWKHKDLKNENEKTDNNES